jgi:DNA-binding MarR family transcriptional regulator
VTRAVGADDRRTFVITPTPKGQQIAKRVHRHLANLEEAIGRRVTGDDVKSFLKVVSAVEEEAHRKTIGKNRGERRDR